MFVKGLSTRHTAIGIFRYGVVYEVDEKDHKVRKHVLPLLEGERPALEKISKAEAEKERSAPMQFTPKSTAPKSGATSADLRSALATAQKAQSEAETDAADAEKRAAEAEAKVDALEAEAAKVDPLTQELASAKKRAAEAEAKVAALDAELKETAAKKAAK